jgi:hypothetical protein
VISRDLDILEENGCIEGKKVKLEKGKKKIQHPIQLS